LEGVFVLVGAIAVAGCILVPEVGLVVVGGCAAVWFLALVGEAGSRQNRRNTAVLGGALPLIPYFLSFPREHSIVTLDRVAILFAFTGLYFAKHSTLIEVPRKLRRAGLAWLGFIAVAGVTLRKIAECSEQLHTNC